jgi:hypothetical protein
LPCPVLIEKIFRFARRANHLYKPAPSRLTRGAARDRHETRGGMRWTRRRGDERAARGRQSRVVLVPRRWDQVGGNNFRRRRWQKSPVTEEITKETVKTIARGMPGETGVTVVTTLVCSLYFACEAAGALGAPGIPCALTLSGERLCKTRALSAPRDCRCASEIRCLKIESETCASCGAARRMG